jgi:predicted nucleotidyltransferase
MTRSIFREVIIDLVFQDSSLMDHIFLGRPIYSRTELIIRCLILSLLTLILWNIFKPMNAFWIISIIFMSHFINWLFNGHGYQILYEAFGMKYSANKAIKYVLKLKRESERKNFHVMIYGSWSRGEAAKTSDLDIFIVNVQGGLLNGLGMGFTSLKYRLIALSTPLSVDIYVIDRIDYLSWRSKAKPDERPIILSDPTGIIRSIYGRESGFEKFLGDVLSIYNK